MQKYMLAILVAMLMGLSACDDNTADDESSGGISLESELSTIGNVVELQSNDSIVQAKVTDDDDDNVADGLDLSGSGASDLIYVEGAFSVKTLVRDISSVGFYAAGDPDQTTYYFSSDANEIVISTEEDGGGNEVVFVVESGVILGLDTDGDGTADDTTLEGISVVIFESNINEYYIGTFVGPDGEVIAVNELTYTQNSASGDESIFDIAAIVTGKDQIVVSINDEGGTHYSRLDFQETDTGIFACNATAALPLAGSLQEALEYDTPNFDTATGCSPSEWKALTPMSLDIAGSYTDGFQDHSVNFEKWVQVYTPAEGEPQIYTYHVLDIDFDNQYLIAINDSSNSFNPGLYSRFTWTEQGGTLYYCQSPSDSASFSDADTASPPDDTDPANSGCGGFSWSTLTPQ